MRDVAGDPLNVTIIPGGIIDVDGTYVDGDLTGEGVVDFRVHACADATTAGPIQGFQACLQHR